MIKDDQYFIDERTVIWDCVAEEDKQKQREQELAEEEDEDDKSDTDLATLVKEGLHEFHFSFRLPRKNIPCSLESREFWWWLRVSLGDRVLIKSYSD